jgi:hypothetical protein
MPSLAYLKRFFPVQRVSFTPGSQVLSADSAEPLHRHHKTKDPSSWHDNGTVTTLQKKQAQHQVCSLLWCLQTGHSLFAESRALCLCSRQRLCFANKVRGKPSPFNPALKRQGLYSTRQEGWEGMEDDFRDCILSTWWGWGREQCLQVCTCTLQMWVRIKRKDYWLARCSMRLTESSIYWIPSEVLALW